MKRYILILAIGMALTACNQEEAFDATGTFEAQEILLSAESTGKIVTLDVQEGSKVVKDQVLGVIDSVQLYLQKEQLILQQKALLKGKPDVEKQVSALRAQIEKGERELARVSNMLKDGAATQKQYDDIEAQLRVTRSQLDATLSTLNSNTASIEGNAAAIEMQIRQIEDRLKKCVIASPINGTVLVKYMSEGEMAVQGRPLMKIADLDAIYLRAYFTSAQLSDINLGQKVTVVANYGENKRVNYEGIITWIAEESEFTPKSIQTADSRSNLVYAVKISVKNDSYLKIGLYGEVQL